MSLEGLSILGQSRVKPSGKAIPAINPANGSELPTSFHWATADDVSRAAELASKAFAEYRRWPAARRAKFLRLIATLIEGDGPALVERANLETALPAARLQGEIARTCGQLRLFASLIEEGWWVDARHRSRQSRSQAAAQARRPFNAAAARTRRRFQFQQFSLRLFRRWRRHQPPPWLPVVR